MSHQHWKVKVFLGLVAVTCVTAVTITTSECGQTKGCFPVTCTGPSENCDYLVTYKPVPNTDAIEFELRGKGQYVGVGFSTDKFMPDTDILACYKPETGETRVDHFFANVRDTPAKTTPKPSAVQLIESEFTGGVVKCRFTREINPGINNFKDLNQNVFLLVAIGDVDGSQIEYHADGTEVSAAQVDLKGVESPESAAAVPALVQAHGALMIIAWVLLASVGMFIARYTRTLWDGKELFGGKVWFQAHRVVMTTTVLATIVGVVLIFVDTKRWSENAGAHPYLGIIVLALAIAQPVMAAFRPHPGEAKRFIFNWAHRGVGTSALVLGVATVFLGVYLPRVRLDMKAVYLMIAYCAGVVVIVAFELALLVSKTSRTSPSPPSMGTTGGFQIEEPKPSQTSSSISNQESALRFIMLAFVVVLTVSVTIALVVLISTAG